MNASEKRARLRSILTGDRFVRPAGIHDALSARAAEVLGYEMMIMTGSAASLAVLGAPDLAIITLTELAQQARRVTLAASLPLLVDADNGFGNALNVRRCVQELEAAGVSALSVEDTLLPQAFGESDEDYISIRESAAKLRAALEARGDPGLIILARTSAVRGEGIDRAISRARAYEATGVDGLFFSGLRSRAALEALRAVCSLPFVISGASAELEDDAYLLSQGVRIGGWSHRPIQAATAAVYDALRDLRKEVPGVEAPKALASEAVVDTLSRKRDYDQNIARYLR